MKSLHNIFKIQSSEKRERNESRKKSIVKTKVPMVPMDGNPAVNGACSIGLSGPQLFQYHGQIQTVTEQNNVILINVGINTNGRCVDLPLAPIDLRLFNKQNTQSEDEKNKSKKFS